jgi:small subunit ribosomal protein S6
VIPQSKYLTNSNPSQVRPGRGVNEIKEYVCQSLLIHSPTDRVSTYRIAKTAGNQVLTAGGVVRGITNWGTFLLPKPVRKAGTLYHQGHYFILRFDSSAKTQHAVRRTLGLDPRMIRFSLVKMGSKLDEIAEIAGKAEWGSPQMEGQ